MGHGRRDVLCPASLSLLDLNKWFPPSKSHSTQLYFESKEGACVCLQEVSNSTGRWKHHCAQVSAGFQEENTSSLLVVPFFSSSDALYSLGGIMFFARSFPLLISCKCQCPRVVDSVMQVFNLVLSVAGMFLSVWGLFCFVFLFSLCWHSFWKQNV